jgi:hypothetical protein
VKRIALCLLASAFIVLLGVLGRQALRRSLIVVPVAAAAGGGADPSRAMTGGPAVAQILAQQAAPAEIGIDQHERLVQVPDLAAGASAFGELIVKVRRDDNDARTRFDQLPPVLQVPVFAATQLGDPWAEEFEEKTDDAGIAHLRVPPGDWICRTSAGGTGSPVPAHVDASGRCEVELRMPMGCQVDGLVTDAEGRPIADADVMIADAVSGSRFHPVARTGPKGEFELEQVGTSQRLAVAHEQYAPSLPQFVFGEPGKRTHVTFMLGSQFARFRGTVRDHTGAPIAGARLLLGAEGKEVTRPPLSAPAPQSLTTDADGRFESRPFAPGPQLLRGTAAGFGPMQVRVEGKAGAVQELDVRMSAGAALHGTVRDADGAPAPRTLVRCGELHAFGTRWTCTADDGSYTLDDLPGGAVDAEAFQPRDQRAAETVQLASGTRVEWSPQLQRRGGGVLRGRLVSDSHGEPLPSWRVLAADPENRGEPLAVLTTATGNFELRSLAPGSRVCLRAFAPDTVQRGFPDATLDDVPVDGPPVEFRVSDAARERGSISGSVVDPAGRPISATIAIQHLQSGAWAMYSTRNDGTFELGGLPAGTLRVQVQHKRYPTVRVAPFELGGGQAAEIERIQFAPGHAIYGTITGPDGRFAARATIKVLHADASEAGDAAYVGGSYRSDLVPPGSYVLLVQADDLAPARTPVTVDATDVEKNVKLTAGFPCRIAVELPAELKAASFANLVLVDDGDHLVWCGSLRLQARTAEFLIWLAPGVYGAVAFDERQRRDHGRLECHADAVNAALHLRLHEQ